MTGLIIILSLIMLFVVVLQIAKINDIASEIRGPQETMIREADSNGRGFLIFGLVFMVAFVISAMHYTNRMLGYGPLKSASEHGGAIDSMFNITVIFTAIVFFICHIALFWFAYKYRYKPNRKVLFMPHDNRLEVIWTALPAIVMTILVVKGLQTWNKVMSDVSSDENYMEIEATAWQFAWNLRYPGPDGKLGVKDFRLIKPGVNELGQDWNDDRNLDDYNSDELVIPKGKKIRVRIIARDVLHNFYLPHFRVKMDAVPGIPTYFIFTPIKTTEEFRQELRKYPEYNIPSDPTDPTSPPKWKTFNYELACAELCGKGHYSMRRLVKVVSPEEYEVWAAKQKSFYLSNIRNTDEDPHKGKYLDIELESKAKELKSSFMKAMDTANTNAADRTIILDNIYFESGSANLNAASNKAIEVITDAFNTHPNLKIELSGHTDNVGDANANLTLSQQRALALKTALIAKGITADKLITVGMGQTKPIADNATEDGRAKNRRIECKVLSY